MPGNSGSYFATILLISILLYEFIMSILQCTYFILIISVQMMTDLEEMERCQDHVDQANYVKAMDHVVLVSISL